MGNYVCELNNIYKTYQNKTILNDINIQLEKGRIYGFIGKNGAGKTTTMRIIAGLAHADSGQISIFGANKRKALEIARRNIGSIIEKPSLFLGMTAKNNLKALCILYGIKSKNRIHEILDLIGLSNTGNKKAKHFSLGMRQRLGIGMALINEPALLILDEPINGLDPDGIVEIRNLIKKINENSGVTILISSHILSELYLIVDHYILINDGKIVEQLSQQELNEKCQKYVLIRSGDTEIIKKILRDKLKTENFKPMDDGSVRVYDYTEDVMAVMNAFAGTGIDTNGISAAEDSLEEYFFKRIG